MKLVLVFALSLIGALANAKSLSCNGISPDAEKVVITANIESATLLTNVVLSFDGDVRTTSTINGTVDDMSDPSPQEGIRFYFHSGNTSEFLIFDPQALENALSTQTLNFAAEHIFEQYERGGSQFITELSCTAF